MICDIGDITSSSVSRKHIVWAGHFFPLLSVHLCLRNPWAAEERVSGCVVVGDRSSTCLRHTFVRGVRSESASYACYLPDSE